MAHALILGMTQSGKTTLAKKLATMYRDNGVGVLVYDPLSDPDWDCDYKSSDLDEFLATLWNSRSCAVFIDEAGDVAGQHDKEVQKTATRGRHWGHRMHYISQRGTMINRTIRDQCSNLFLFATALEDVKIHAAEWNKPQLREAANFNQGDYFSVSRFGQLKQDNIFGVKKDATNSETSHTDSRASTDSNRNVLEPEKPSTGDSGKRARKSTATKPTSFTA
jgi:hypothetical protein